MIKRIYVALNEFVSVIPKPVWLIPIFLLGRIMRLSRQIAPGGGFFSWSLLDIIIGAGPLFVLAGMIRLYLTLTDKGSETD
jgi:hypothetical protein